MTDPLRATLQESLGSAFTLQSELSGAGMSRVFVAREEALGRDVVVKVLAPEVSAGLSVERFTREIRVAAALQEPHIVPVLTAGVTSLGMPYYTMPFVRGASLRERMTQGVVPVDEAIRLLRDVAQALAHAHAQHVVHRDIKPENILLSSGSAVVTDFGIAKALRASRTEDAAAAATDTHGITRTGMSLGTPAYMAPEQAAGDPDTDQRADLYAWGVVAYELLAGQHPFASRTTPQRLLKAHMVDVPDALPESRAVPAVVVSLVMQCLQKDPADRPPTAAHVLSVLHGASGSGARESADRAVVAPHVRDAVPRSRNRVMLVGGLVVAALASAGAWWRGSAHGTSGASTPTGPVMMAVLPFEHEGPPDQLPFTNGLTDAVTAKLGALSSLMVIDRRSAATYRGTTKSTQQIGTELGVKFLLEGVVRWAKDGSGVWRARVTPTLVDAKSGAIKWTGEPATVTLEDPFTAQGSIATEVAYAMEVAVLPTERVELKRRFTDNPQAYAAYQRGRDLLVSANRADNVMDAVIRERAIREQETAISLDSSFSAAWGMLAAQYVSKAVQSQPNRDAVEQARRTLSLAQQRAPNEPMVLLSASLVSRIFDNDLARSTMLVRRALSISPNDAETLSSSSVSMQFDLPDSARVLAVRAATLDPRSPVILYTAAFNSLNTHRWSDAEHFIELAIQLDSADQTAWGQRLWLSALRGDTSALRRQSEQLLRHISVPGVATSGWMAYSSNYSDWFLRRSRAQLRVVSAIDSVWYFDNKIDAALVLGNVALSRSYTDSLLDAFGARELSPLSDAPLFLAHAQAKTGKRAMAVATLERSLGEARKLSRRQYPAEFLDGRNVGAVYAALGDTVEALRWIEASLTNRYTIAWFLIDPRLREFRRSAAWRAFVRAHPDTTLH